MGEVDDLEDREDHRQAGCDDRVDDADDQAVEGLDQLVVGHAVRARIRSPASCIRRAPWRILAARRLAHRPGPASPRGIAEWSVALPGTDDSARRARGWWRRSTCRARRHN